MKNALIFISLLVAGIVIGKGGGYLYGQFVQSQKSGVLEGDYSQEITGRPVLFVTSTCPYCKQAVDYLDSMGLDYEKQVIDQSFAAKERYNRLGQKAVPVLVTSDLLIIGFKPPEYEKFLGQTKL